MQYVFSIFIKNAVNDNDKFHKYLHLSQLKDIYWLKT